MANQIVVSAGAKVRDLEGVLVGTVGVVSSLPINASNGIPQLDVNGKILVSQLPNSVMEYKGTWSAATNTPTLADGTGNQGDVYLCNVDGTVNFGAGAIPFFVGDSVIYSGTIWQKASGATGTVTSVAASITGSAVGVTGSPITTSGTLAFAFAGTNLQYVNGAGNLTTFPLLTGYVPYTGATTNLDLGVYDLTADIITGGTIVKSGGTSGQFLKADGSVDSSVYALDSAVVHNTGNETIGGTKTFTDATKNNGGIFLQNASSNSLSGYMNLGGLTNGVKFTSGGGVSNNFTLPSAVGYTFTFPAASGTLALTSDLTGYVTAVTASSPLSSSGGVTPNITIALATTSANGYLSSADWNTFNGKQTALSGTGFVKIVGTTISYDNSTYYLASNPSAFIALTALSSSATGLTYTNTTGVLSLTSGYSIPTTASQATWNTAYNDSIVSAAVTGTTTKTLTLTQQDAGTITASWTDINTDAVTSVFGRTGAVVAASADYNTSQVTELTNLYYTEARVNANTNVAANTAARHNALTIGTASGLSLSTQVLSLALATTSVTGALSSTDFTTFNNKQSTVTLTTTGTSGVATFSANTLNIPNYGSALSGYLPLTGGTLTGALNIGTISSGVNVNLYASSYGSNGLLNAYGTDNILKLQLGALGTNEGFIYTGSGNKITFYSGGVVALTLNSNQTTTLTGALTGTSATFSGNGAFSGVLQVAPTTGTGIIGVGDNFGGGMNAGIYRGGLGVITTGNYLNIGGYDGVIITTGAAALGSQTVRLTVTSGGNVGIGTTAPVTLLSIETSGVQNTVSPIITAQSAGTTYAGMYSVRDGAGDQRGLVFKIYTANVGLATALTIASSGAATFSGIINANASGSSANGSVNIESADPTLRFRVTGGSANKRIYEWRAIAAGGIYDYLQLRLWNDAQSSASELLQIASTGAATFSSGIATNGYTASTSYAALFNGNVGIGTTAPVAELQVGKASDVTFALSNSSSVTSGTRGSIAWYNSSVSTVANIKAVAVTDNVGTQLEFYTRPVAGSLTLALTLAASGAATFSSTIKTAGFGSTTARTWKLGELVTATVIGVNTTGYITIEVNGSQYNLAIANLA